MLGRALTSKPPLFVFHFDSQTTRRMFCQRTDGALPRFLTNGSSRSCGGWNTTSVWSNGYEAMSQIPMGAVVLVTICHAQNVPLDWLQQRTDLRRVVYTAEIPPTSDTLLSGMQTG